MSTQSARHSNHRKLHIFYSLTARLRRVERRLNEIETDERLGTDAKKLSAVNSTSGENGPTHQSVQSRIRRRALDILLSLGGTLILGLQTFILYQQTTLIAKQTEALQLDQSAHLRDHIIAASDEEATVKRLVTGIESIANSELSDAPLKGAVLKTKNFSIDACTNANCLKSSVDSALRSLGEDKPNLDKDVGTGVLRMGVFLGRLDTKLSAVDSPREITFDKSEDKLGELRKVYTLGITACFFDPARARELSEAMTTLRILTSNAFSVLLPTQPDEYQEMVSKFPQVGSNTKMGLIQMQSAAAAIMRGDNVASGRDGGPDNYTFAEFIPALTSSILKAVAGLHELDSTCKATISRDVAALKSMTVSAER
jgi:hypothetical protein